MFSEIIDIDNIEATEIFEVLYDYFCEDFIDSKAFLNKNIYINPKSYKKEDGKELVFWHLTSRETSYTKKVDGRYIKFTERLPDYRRSERLHWIKKIIENHNNISIKLFYYMEKTKRIRLYLWAYENDFLVILEKIGKNSSYLVTSFYIDKHYNKKTYHTRYNDYVNKKDKNLLNCEWF